jgi:hypothetical protein
VIAALNGRPGFLTVRYRAAPPLKAPARAVMEGDVRQAAGDPDLFLDGGRGRRLDRHGHRGRPAQADCEKGIGDADASLLSKTREIALQHFAHALRNWLSRQKPMLSGESVLHVEAMESEMVDKDLDRAADVSEWFEPGEGLRCRLRRHRVSAIPSPGGAVVWA